MRHTYVLAWTALIGFCPAMSYAGDTAILGLHGEIKPECTVNVPSSSIDLGDIMFEGTQTISFHVFCNHPFSYRISSRNGGLKMEKYQPRVHHFKTLIPYNITISLPTTGGGIVDSCSSLDVKEKHVQCRLRHSGNQISADAVSTLTISWNANDKIPVAGTYSDTINFSVSSRL